MERKISHQKEIQNFRLFILIKHLSLFLILGFGISNCASYTDKTKGMRQHYRTGQFKAALSELESSGIKKDSNSALLYFMESGMIYDRLGEETKSRQALLAASDLVDKLFTVSISKTAASFLVNEQQQDYRGEDYEVVHIHTMLALNFIGDGDFRSARVEAKRINERLNSITKEYDPKHRHYIEDAFARYLTGMIYEFLEEYDSAIIDYRKALAIYSSGGYAKFFSGRVPKSLIQALYRMSQIRNRKEILQELDLRFPNDTEELKKPQNKKTGVIYLIHEEGHIQTKKAKEFIWGAGKQIVRFSFPYIPYSSNTFYSSAKTGAQVNHSSFTRADNTSHLSAIAHYSLEDRRGRMLLKDASRLLIKGQLNRRAREEFGPLGGVLANIFTVATETADTRSWSSLPDKFYVTRMELPPGKVQLEAFTQGKTVGLLETTIMPGKSKIYRALSL